MQPISPMLQAKISQQPFVVNQATQNYAKETGLKQDVVEISNKNKNNTKTAIKIGAGVALATMATIAILNGRDLSKAKKDLTALYDTIFENMNKNATDSINFEKPKLVFKKLDKTIGADYSPNTNAITLDPRRLRRLMVNKNLDRINLEEIADGLKIAHKSYKGNIFDLCKKNIKNNLRMATRNEALALEGSSIAHELTHAKQFQQLLSSEGGRERYISYLQEKSPHISQEDLQKVAPFVFAYKPKNITSQTEYIMEELCDGTRFRYSINDIINAFANYAKDNKYKYYTNLTEISARNSEANYWSKIINGELPRPEGISDEFLKSMATITRHNARTLMQAVSCK